MLNGYKICLDPGHGEGYNQSPVVPEYREGTRMWEYSWILKKELEEQGFEVFHTRPKITDDPLLSDRGYYAGTKKCDLMLSLHSNAPGSSIGPDGKKYYDPTIKGAVAVPTIRALSWSKPFAMDLAQKVGELMGSGVRAVFTKESDSMPGWDWYGILKYSMWYGCKNAVIIEHGFHTNEEDARWLLSDKNLQNLAKVETAVICQHFNVPYHTVVTYETGDVNMDGKIDISDITTLLNVLSGSTVADEEHFKAADVNGDGKIDVSDVTEVLNILSEGEKDEDIKEGKVMVELDVLKDGSRGNQVKSVQVLLNSYECRDQDGKELSTDGVFGEKTKFAVRLFQKRNKLTVDGIVGENTWNKLLK